MYKASKMSRLPALQKILLNISEYWGTKDASLSFLDLPPPQFFVVVVCLFCLRQFLIM